MCETAEEGRWVRTDEAEDVAASVRHALRCFDLIEEDVQAWKWMTLALHSALQGACVCHLVTSASPVGAVTERNAGEWLKYFEALRADPKARAPQTYIMALPDLLKAVRMPRSAGDRSNELGVQITDRELRWLKRFHQGVRNQFVHFEPMGWSLEVSGVPDLTRLITRIIDDMIKFGWAFRHKNDDWRKTLHRDLSLLAQRSKQN
jgi:hypothetical protein